MGSDGAGVVERIGPGVNRFRPGDTVCGQFMNLPYGRGSYAEYVLAAEDGTIARMPEDLPFAAAATLPTAGVTDYQAIEAARLDTGHVILINGASDFAAAPTAEQVLAAHPEGIDAVLDLVTQPGGDIDVTIDAEVPLADAPTAVARARAGGSRGKTVILP